jgi:hypothetical protein
MRAERNYAIALLEFASDRSHFVTEAGDLDGAPGNPRCVPVDQPDAWTLARIDDRTNRYLERRCRPAVRDLDGDG